MRLFSFCMKELSVYPQGRADELPADSVVLVLKDDGYLEKTVSELQTGDLYKTKMHRLIRDRGLKECLEYFLLNRMQLSYKTGDQSEVQGSDIMIFTLNEQEVAFFPTDDDYIMEDFHSAMQYIIDTEEEKEY